MVKTLFQCEDAHCLVRTTKSSTICQYEKVGLTECKSPDEDKKYWKCQGCNNFSLCGACAIYYASSLETYNTPTSSVTKVKAGSNESISNGGGFAETSGLPGGSPSTPASSILPKVEKKHVKAKVLGRVKQKKKRVLPWKVLINEEWFSLRTGAKVKSGNLHGQLLNVLEDKVDIKDANNIVHTVPLSTLSVEMSTFSVEAILETNFLSEDEKLDVGVVISDEIESYKGCLSVEILELPDGLKFCASFDTADNLRNFDNCISTTFMFKLKKTAGLEASTIIRVSGAKLNVVENPGAEKTELYYCWNLDCKKVFTSEYQLKQHLFWDPENVQRGSECMKLMHNLCLANHRNQTHLEKLRRVKASEVDHTELLHCFQNLQKLTKDLNFVENNLVGKYVKRGLENSRKGSVLKVRFPMQRQQFVAWNKGCSKYWAVSDVMIRVIKSMGELSTFIAEENLFVEKNLGQIRKRIIVKENLPFKATWRKFNTGERGGSKQIGIVTINAHTNQII